MLGGRRWLLQRWGYTKEKKTLHVKRAGINTRLELRATVLLSTAIVVTSIVIGRYGTAGGHGRHRCSMVIGTISAVARAGGTNAGACCSHLLVVGSIR